MNTWLLYEDIKPHRSQILLESWSKNADQQVCEKAKKQATEIESEQTNE